MRVLLADDDAEAPGAARAGRLARALAADPGLTLLRRPFDQTLAEAAAALAPDILVLAMARPDRAVLDNLRQIAALAPRPVALFVDHDDPGFMAEAIEAGVSAYTLLGAMPPDMAPILRAAAALFGRYQAAEAARLAAEARWAERAVIDRAKAALMKHRRLSEPEAYRWLRRRAMDRGRRIVEIAEALLADGLV